MTINAAMPAVAPNQSYTGTAAATDMTGTAGDFSGTLGNMMNGGAHAGPNAPDIQEFLVVPIGAANMTEAVFANVAVHKKLKELIDSM